LYHFRYRDYSPTLGRWTTQDPLGFAAGDVNLYRAVGNGPTNATDPSGLWEGQLNENGQGFAISETGDTIQGLISMGCAETRITPLAKGVYPFFLGCTRCFETL
jgi:uncharacterized protein RhaS with RHS repeats